jgi:ribosomal protein S18 acetylase RimI-like enzyme
MPGSIVIRLLTAADADAYRAARAAQVDAEPRAFGESPSDVRARSLEETAELLSAPLEVSFIFGEFVGGEIVGTAGYFRRMEAKTRHKGRVWGVFVAPEFRRQGLGRTLMGTLIDECRALDGLEQIDLTVAAGQTAARTLYQSLGFEPYGREPRALKIGDEYIDEDLLVLRLR